MSLQGTVMVAGVKVPVEMRTLDISRDSVLTVQAIEVVVGTYVSRACEMNPSCHRDAMMIAHRIAAVLWTKNIGMFRIAVEPFCCGEVNVTMRCETNSTDVRAVRNLLDETASAWMRDNTDH